VFESDPESNCPQTGFDEIRARTAFSNAHFLEPDSGTRLRRTGRVMLLGDPKHCGVREDPSPLASAKGSRHNYRLYRARSVNPGHISME
jgi:hypothetical protein